MKKNNPTHYDEIDFFELFRTIWNRKIIVIFTVFVSVAIFSYNENQKPVVYDISIRVNSSKLSEFDQFLLITNFINKNINLNTSVNTKDIYNKFVKNLSNYGEVMNIFEKNKYIKKQISQLTELDKKNILYRYSQSIKINRIDDETAIILFPWHNSKEGKEILTELINLVKKNLKKEVFLELNSRVDLIKSITERNNLIRVDYLSEQNEIAKELNISDNQILNLYQLNINMSQDDIAYYLRGYKAIEKEIELIKSRDFRVIKNVKKLINSLESNNQIKWINFNLYSIKTNSINNFKRNLTLSIIMGLLVAVSYILISRAYHSFKTQKKNN